MSLVRIITYYIPLGSSSEVYVPPHAPRPLPHHDPHAPQPLPRLHLLLKHKHRKILTQTFKSINSQLLAVFVTVLLS